MKYPFKIGLLKDEFDVLLHVISKQPIESCLFNLYDRMLTMGMKHPQYLHEAELPEVRVVCCNSNCNQGRNCPLRGKKNANAKIKEKDGEQA